MAKEKDNGGESESGANYVVIHSVVGPWPKGRIVSEKQLEAAGCDVRRLTELGAIGNTDDPVTKVALAIGPNYNPTLPQHQALVNQMLAEGVDVPGGKKGGKGGEGPALSGMTKKELQDVADEEGIAYDDKMTKEELIAEIEAKREGVEEE